MILDLRMLLWIWLINLIESNVITYYSSINFDDELNIDSNVIISILRIINELNSNAIKYSNGTEIIINVTLKDNNVIIEFKDNGKGFDYYNTVYDRNKNSGFGLTMLKERVALLNGNIKYIYDNGSDFYRNTSLVRKGCNYGG